jgi:cytochrome c553
MGNRLVLLVLCVTGSLTAQAADVEQGRTLSLACQACHGSAGLGTAPDIPNLAGQKAGYLQAQLVAFRGKDRKHDLMNAIAAQLSDADIGNLAAFWSSLPAAGPVDPHGAADPAAEFRKSRMTFPVTFPKDFVVYEEDMNGKNETVKRAYANRVALNAARAGKPLPAGSAIVVENYADKQVTSYAAMESRAGWGDGIPDILRNGDWSYALFDGAKTLRADFNYARCLACHKPVADSSYVFGLKKIAAARQ